MKYEIYVPGFTKPAYVYKTWRSTSKRIDDLAALRSIKRCQVKAIDGNETVSSYTYWFGGGSIGRITDDNLLPVNG